MKSGIQVELYIFKYVKNDFFYLLLKRTAERSGFWQPMTGGNEIGETLLETVKREALEETGISLTDIIDTKYKFDFIFDKKTYIEHVFAAQVPSDVQVNLSDEHDDYCWVTYDDALSLLLWDDNKKGLKNVKDMIS